MKTLSTPLFWDLHIHGVAGIDFMSATADDMANCCEKLGRRGIGYFAPTLLTDSDQNLLKASALWGKFLIKAKQKSYLPKHWASPIGLHLEGPFLSAKKSGAHPPLKLQKPSLSLLKNLLKSAQGQIAIMTLAPELQNSLKSIEFLKKNQVRVQIGHTIATPAQVKLAMNAGAKGITHLFNAMEVHHRQPGVLGFVLRDQLLAECITDTHHIHPDYLLMALRAAGESIYGVSDGCCATGAKPKAWLKLGSLRIQKKGPIAVLKNGTMAGGATYLTEHPALLKKGLQNAYPSKKILELFYKHQQTLFPVWSHQKKAQRCRFHAETLQWLS